MASTKWLAVLVGCSTVPEVPEAAPPPACVAAEPEGVAEVAEPPGAELFARVWTPNDPRTPGGDGLGPVFNAESCAACHHLGGPGGAGGSEVNVTMQGGKVVPRARLFELELGTRLAGTRFVAPVVQRATPALFGAGVIDTIPDDVLIDAEALGAPQFPEVTGRVGRDPDGRVTRFGWKGNVASLASFVERACANELGLGTPTVPQPGAAAPGPDLDEASVRALVDYVASLPQPVELDTPGMEQGRALFTDIGCASCHREELGDVAGLYTDLLLHDLGRDLSDAAAAYYGTSGDPTVVDGEWRTPPLWGLRDSAPYLHDGRATTVQQAIAEHGGEAAKITRTWSRLSPDDQALIVRFLHSLAAPAS